MLHLLPALYFLCMTRSMHAPNMHAADTAMTEVRGPFSDIMGKRRLWVRHLPANEACSWCSHAHQWEADPHSQQQALRWRA